MRVIYLKENILKFREDVVHIFNGENEFAPRIAYLTGYGPSLVESTGNTVFIKFQSDDWTMFFDVEDELQDEDPWTGFKIFYEAGKGHCNQLALIQYKVLFIFCRISNLKVVVY